MGSSVNLSSYDLISKVTLEQIVTLLGGTLSSFEKVQHAEKETCAI